MSAAPVRDQATLPPQPPPLGPGDPGVVLLGPKEARRRGETWAYRGTSFGGWSHCAPRQLPASRGRACFLSRHLNPPGIGDLGQVADESLRALHPGSPHQARNVKGGRSVTEPRGAATRRRTARNRPEGVWPGIDWPRHRPLPRPLHGGLYRVWLQAASLSQSRCPQPGLARPRPWGSGFG